MEEGRRKMELKVWLLEPDKETAEKIRYLWELTGGKEITVRRFGSMGTMLKAGSKQIPDLIMGELTEVEKIRKVFLSDLIAVTSDRRSSTFTRLQRCGMIDVVLKPFSSRRMIRSIRHYLELRKGLSKGDRLTQRELDQYFFPIGMPNQMTKGEQRENPDHTGRLREIIRAVTDAEPQGLSVAELTHLLKVSRSTIWRDIEILLKEELLYGADRLNGKKGRPMRVYRIRRDI